jgi:tRNA(fMet)-specific endonuclease VapC
VGLNLAIDANRYTDFLRGLPEVTQVISSAERLFLPFIVVGELRGGFRKGARCDENERQLTRFLRKENVDVLFADEATTHIYAGLYCDLSRAGTPIPPNDLWIAALVVQHDLVLFSRDKHFDRIARLPRV